MKHIHLAAVAEQHAQLSVKLGRPYCKALSGDDDDFLAPTRCWLNDNELRKGVDYLLPPDGSLAFGSQGNKWEVKFEEQGSNDPVVDMLMQKPMQSFDFINSD
eukprot:jgi/Astpho2/5257/Aster-x0245